MDGGASQERLLGGEAEDSSNMREGICTESKKIWRIAVPAILSRVALLGTWMVTQAFIGHIGEVEFAAYAMVQAILLRFAIGITLGMSSATETLCGQAFGAKQYHMMGIYLQRSWIINTVTTTILLPLFFFATPILRLLGEDEDIASQANTLALWCIPQLYSLIFSATIQMYLQAQLKNFIIILITLTAFLLQILLSWLFVDVFDYGVSGAMGALGLSNLVLVLGEFVYVFGGWCPETWRGFTKAAFYDIFPVLKLSVSSGLMICLELWYSSVLVLLAGYMKNATIAISTFSICLNVITCELMIGLGFLVAASVRVSNELGAGNTKAAKFAVKVILSISICVGVFFSVLCFLFSSQISYLFSSSEAIAKSVSSLRTLLAISVFLNGAQPVLSGVAVGAGWQSVVAFINIGSYYVIGIPAGALLGYVAHMQVMGIWIGMIFGVATQTFVLFYMTWKTDWEEQVINTSERLNRWLLKPSEEAIHRQSHTSEA
ncbi:MATE efflux family protein [Tripterygium wilfordii]|uniref:Protein DETOXIFICATION n=1 Tax=Tripterygium wilfordii TaxID=458696 RepID=A0A7J7BVQ6_TRIWF|nr:protein DETOXIFICATION 24-like [Tripterygium wilfordii]KAF5725979.1 MATE efflux family protein [Tripterygium wilfordii]